MVTLFRRKRQMRLVTLAIAVLGALIAWRVAADGVDEYVPGSEVEGLTDSLARGLPEGHPAASFVDVTAEAGLTFHHFPALRGNRLPEDMGSGVALGDMDDDGWVDVYAVNIAHALADTQAPATGDAAHDGRCRLFRNRGDHTFEDVSDSSGTGLSVMGMAAAFADVEGDGDLDLLVSAYGRCTLLVNDGQGRFVDRSEASGVGLQSGFWAGMAVGDYDGDDDVDLYVTGYVRYDESKGSREATVPQYATEIPAMINPSAFEPQPNLLLRNRGDGTFDEVAEEVGVDDPHGRGLGAVFADLSGDGSLDLYVANDVSDNVLFHNLGDGTFVDLTSRALVGDYRGAMGLAVSDFDNDLDLDLFITHWVAQENALYVNITSELAEEGQAPTMMFFDEADKSGLGQVALHKVGWATRFFDLDNDGERDLFVVNGSTIPLSDERTRLEPMAAQLFWNAGQDRGFFEIGAIAGPFFAREVVGRGGATFDYDQDGDEDLLFSLHGDGLVLLENRTPSGSCLRVRLRQPAGNTRALGARLTVRAAGRVWTDQVGTDGSYLSQHAVGETAFGLGDATVVESLEVVWPDGSRETIGPLPADRLVTWLRGQPPRVESFAGRPGSAAEPPSTGEGGQTAATAARPDDSRTLRRFYALEGEGDDARLAGEGERAVERYRSALALWPGHDHCSYYLANTLIELDREGQALSVLQQLVLDQPRSSRAWMQLGRLRLPGGDTALDDLPAAAEAFRRAHEINGEESGPVVQLGVVALLEGDLDRADGWFADAAASNSRSLDALYYRGYIAWLRGDGAAAASHLEAARHLAEGQTRTSGSASSEGQTRGGESLLAERQDEGHGLSRWTTLLQRPADPDLEYGGLHLR